MSFEKKVASFVNTVSIDAYPAEMVVPVLGDLVLGSRRLLSRRRTR